MLWFMQIMHPRAKVVVLCRLTMSNLPSRVVSTIVSRNHRPRRYVSRWLGFFFLIRKMLLSLASSLNSVPLPPVSNRYGIRLPAPEHCLTNVNFSIVPDPPPMCSLDTPLFDHQPVRKNLARIAFQVGLETRPWLTGTRTNHMESSVF